MFWKCRKCSGNAVNVLEMQEMFWKCGKCLGNAVNVLEISLQEKLLSIREGFRIETFHLIKNIMTKLRPLF